MNLILVNQFLCISSCSSAVLNRLSQRSGEYKSDETTFGNPEDEFCRPITSDSLKGDLINWGIWCRKENWLL